MEPFNFLNMKNKICRIKMFYELIEFKNTIIKSYYRISIEVNENTTVVSNDEQMLSAEKEPSNDHEKIIDQFLKSQNTRASEIILNAITPNAITPSAIIFDADASNATAPSVSN